MGVSFKTLIGRPILRSFAGKKILFTIISQKKRIEPCKRFAKVTIDRQNQIDGGFECWSDQNLIFHFETKSENLPSPFCGALSAVPRPALPATLSFCKTTALFLYNPARKEGQKKKENPEARRSLGAPEGRSPATHGPGHTSKVTEVLRCPLEIAALWRAAHWRSLRCGALPIGDRRAVARCLFALAAQQPGLWYTFAILTEL